MKTIDKDEFHRNLTDFLKSKGIELTEGSYAHRIRQGCNLLADAINATQKTVTRTKAGVDRKLDQLRQCIHEATAPKQPRPPVTPTTPPPAEGHDSGQKKTATPRKPPAKPSAARRKKPGR